MFQKHTNVIENVNSLKQLDMYVLICSLRRRCLSRNIIKIPYAKVFRLMEVLI